MNKKPSTAICLLSALVLVLGATCIHLFHTLHTASKKPGGVVPNALGAIAEGAGANNLEAVRENVTEDAQKSIDAIPFSFVSVNPSTDAVKVNFRSMHGGLAKSAREMFSIDPPLKDGFKLDAIEGDSVNIRGGFEPGKSYTIIIGAGLANSKGEALGKEKRYTFTVPKPEPYFTLRNYGIYYPLSRERLLFSYSSCGVTNLHVVVRRGYDTNIPVFGLSYERYESLSHNQKDMLVAEFDCPVDGDTQRGSNHLLDIGKYLANPACGIYKVCADTGMVNVDRWGYRENLRAEFTFALTDLGIAFSTGPSWQNKAYALVTSLGTGKPVPGAEVTVWTRSFQVAGTARTGDNGLAEIKLDPRFRYDGVDRIGNVIAKAGNDISIMSVDDDRYEWESLSCDRTVDFSGSPKALQKPRAYLFSERSLCRPGEAFESSLFLRSAAKDDAKVLGDVPLRMQLFSPDGKLFSTGQVKTDRFGFACTAWTIPSGAQTGKWSVKCLLGNEVVGSQTMAVAAFVPDRFKVKLAPSCDQVVGMDAVVDINGSAEYYFGEPVANGGYSVKFRASSAKMPARWKGWEVGCQSELNWLGFSATGRLSADGSFAVAGKDIFNIEKSRDHWKGSYPRPSVPGIFAPVAVTATADVQEPGGRNVSASCVTVLYPTACFLGVRDSEEDAESDALSFDIGILSALEDGDLSSMTNREISVSLQHEVWHRALADKGGRERWEWQSEMVDMPNLETTLRTPDASGIGSWTGRVDLASSEMPSGRYLMTISSRKDIKTVHCFWYSSGEVTERMGSPLALELEARAEKYAPGETAQLEFTSPCDGSAFVVAGESGIATAFAQAVTQGVNVVEVPIPVRTVAGKYYASVTLVTQGDLAERRLYALAAIKIDSSSRRHLDVGLELPEKAAPGEEIEIKVALKDASGSPVEGLVKIGAIDEGVAVLDGFKVGSPFKWFFGTDFGVPFMCCDFFDDVIPELKIPSEGKIGGDEAPSSISMNREGGDIKQKETARLALAPVVVSTNGHAVVKVRLPDHTGALRFTAVAGNDIAVGSTEDTLVMREKISVLATAPRFALCGDRFTLTTTLFNHDTPAGGWLLKVTLPEGFTSNGKREIEFNGSLETGKSDVRRCDVEIGKDLSGSFAIAYEFSLGGEMVAGEALLTVRPAMPFTTVAEYSSCDGGKLVLPSARAKWHNVADRELTLYGSPAYGIGASLSWLENYPYGCLEQTTSQVFPFLAVDDLERIGAIDAAGRTAAEARMKVAYARILGMYFGYGLFSMWPGEKVYWTYGSLFAEHYLFEAEKLGAFTIDPSLRNEMLNTLRGLSENADPQEREDRAWATYILSVAGDIAFANAARNIISVDKADFATLLASAALLRGGFASEGIEPFKKALAANAWDSDYITYHTQTQRMGFALYLAARSGLDGLDDLLPLVIELNQSLRADGTAWGTTRDNAWATLGIAAFAAKNSSGKSTGKITIGDEVIDFDLSGKPLKFELSEDDEVIIDANGFVCCNETIIGVPKVPMEPGEVKVTRSYVDASGKPVKKIGQGELVTAVVTISSPYIIDDAVYVDLVPGGFELEDLTLFTRSSEGAFMPKDIKTPVGFSEIRDDRWLWFGVIPGDNSPQTLVYTLRAVVPGSYALPTASIEDMYDPDFRGAFTTDDTVVITGE